MTQKNFFSEGDDEKIRRPLPNLLYYTLYEVYIRIHYLLCNTYYTSFVLILFENDNNVAKRLVLELQFLNWYWFSFPILFLNK